MEDPATAPAVPPADAIKQEEAPAAAVPQSEQPSTQDSQPRETESLVQNLDALQLKDQQKQSATQLPKAGQQHSSVNRIKQDEDKDLASAKQWMMEKKGKEGKSLYDHLVKVVSKLVDEKPQNALGTAITCHNKWSR